MAAAPSPWISTSESLIKLTASTSSTFVHHFNFSRRRRCIPAWSFCTPPNCCSTSTDSSSPRRQSRKSVDLVSRIRNEPSFKNFMPGNGAESRKVGSKARNLTFKSLLGKRSLWRRIFFASKKVRSIILLNVITLVYASTIPVVKEVEAVVDPGAFNVIRFALSAIPFVPFVVQARHDAQTRNAGLELGFWVTLGYLMQALGLLTSDAGRASFISMLTVIVVPMLDGMLGAVVPARTWFGALMSIVGVAMLESSGSPPCVGDLLNFLSAVFFGVHMLRTEHISRSTSKEKILPLLGYEVCVVALFSASWYFFGSCHGGLQELNPSSWNWAAFLAWMTTFPWIPAFYTGMFSTGLCLWIEMAAMCDVSATETAIIYGLEPVWGASFAWFLLGERWGEIGWIGAALVLAGSLVVQIYGMSSLFPSQGQKQSKKTDGVLISERNGYSASPIVVSSRQDSSDLLNK